MLFQRFTVAVNGQWREPSKSTPAAVAKDGRLPAYADDANAHPEHAHPLLLHHLDSQLAPCINNPAVPTNTHDTRRHPRLRSNRWRASLRYPVSRSGAKVEAPEAPLLPKLPPVEPPPSAQDSTRQTSRWQRMGDTLRAFGRLWMNGSQESTPAEASSELHQPLHPPACADTSERTDEVRPRRHSLYSQIHPTATTAVVPAILDTSSDSSSTHNTVAPAPAGRLSGATLADTADLPQQRPLALHTHGLASCDTLCLSSSAQSTGVESDDIAPLPAVARKSMANAANHPKSRASRRHTVTSAVATSLRQALLNMRIQ